MAFILYGIYRHNSKWNYWNFGFNSPLWFGTYTPQHNISMCVSIGFQNENNSRTIEFKSTSTRNDATIFLFMAYRIAPVGKFKWKPSHNFKSFKLTNTLHAIVIMNLCARWMVSSLDLILDFGIFSIWSHRSRSPMQVPVLEIVRHIRKE